MFFSAVKVSRKNEWWIAIVAIYQKKAFKVEFHWSLCRQHLSSFAWSEPLRHKEIRQVKQRRDTLVLFSHREEVVSFRCQLSYRFTLTKKVCSRLFYVNKGFLEVMNHLLRKPTSNACRLFCTFIDHHVFSAYYHVTPAVDKNRLLLCIKHLIW